jgi:hypothetical protein
MGMVIFRTPLPSIAEMTVSKALDWVADIVGKQASLYSLD